MIRPLDAPRRASFRRRRDRVPSWAVAIILAASLLPSRASAAPAPVDVRLLSEDDNGVLFEYILPAPEPRPVPGDRVILRIPGAALAEEIGYPAVPSRAILVALPPGAAAEARLVESTVAEVDSFRIAPMPDLEGGEPVFGDWSPDLEEGLYPADWIETEPTAFLRDMRVFRLLLHPARYDRRTGKTVLLTSAKVEVRFRGGKPAEARGRGSGTTDAFDPVYRRAVLNHASGAAWKTLPAKREIPPARPSFSASPFWIRMEIAEKGLHRVTYADFLTIGILDPGDALGDPRELRIFAADPLPLDPNAPGAPGAWMKQIAIRVSGEEDGSFDPWDFIEFYALPPFGWRGELAPASGAYHDHLEHPYTTRSVFWLAPGGGFAETPARIAAVDAGPEAAGAGPVALATFPERVHSETDLYEDFSRYGEDGWFMERFSPWEKNKSFLVPTPDADTTQDASVRVRFFHYADDMSQCGTERVTVTVNGREDPLREWNSCRQIAGTIQPFDHESSGHRAADGNSRFDMTVSFRSKIYLCWIEMGYERFFRARDGSLTFRLAAPGDYRVPIAGFSADTTRVLDVTDPRAVKELTGLTTSGDSLVLHASIDAPRTYYAFDPPRVLRPATFEWIAPADLRTPESGAEYLILAADELAGSVQALAERRSAETTVRVVRLSSVYAEFAGGIPDPVAIRDFLSHAHRTWPEGEKPAAVLLVGDAVFDTRDREGTPNRILLPAYLRVDRGGSETHTYLTDDFFTYLGTDTIPDRIPDIAIGRLPARTAEEAARVATKIGAYGAEGRAAGSGRVLLAADDERKGDTYDCGFLLGHTEDAEDLARLLPDRYEKERVYMVLYPLDERWRKPEATADLLRLLRNGALFFSYSGHGGFDKLADEDLLILGDLAGGALPAGTALPLFTAWSCDVGRFGLLDRDCLAEALLEAEGAGAIGAVAGSAPTFGGVNQDIAEGFVGALFPELGESPPVGMALLAAKASLPRNPGRITNDEKYNLLGDPLVRLSEPELGIRFEGLDTLAAQRGSTWTVRGEVVDGSGEAASWFEGTALLDLRADANPLGYTLLDSVCYGSPSLPRAHHVDFPRTGDRFFRGPVTVSGGRFSASLFVPLDAAVGPNGRIAAHAFSASGGLDAHASSDSLAIVSQVDGYKPSDRDGPRITVRADGRPAREGSWIRPEARFEVEAVDPSGIYQGSEDRWRLACALDGAPAIDLSDRFALEADSYTEGSLRFRWSDLAGRDPVEGEHVLLLRAFDNIGNGTEVSLQLVFVPELPGLAFRGEIWSVPNPFDPAREEAEFFVDLTRDADVRIQIFTLTGKRIRVFDGCRASGASRLAGCTWDGRDEDGDRVANGVYLIRAIATTPDGSETAESIGKTVLMHQRW